MSWIRFPRLHCRRRSPRCRHHYCYFSIACLQFHCCCSSACWRFGRKMKRRMTIIIIIIIHFASFSIMIERPWDGESEKRSKGQFWRQGISTGQKESPKNFKTTHDAYRKGPIVVMIANGILLQTASFSFLIVGLVVFAVDIIILLNNSCLYKLAHLQRGLAEITNLLSKIFELQI